MPDKEWLAVPREDFDFKTPIVPFTVSQRGEFYNPDFSFIVLGTGAADRLAKLLNLYGVHYETDQNREV